MNAARWTELKNTFAAWIDLPAEERAARLNALGASDAQLQRHLSALFEADARADVLLMDFELTRLPEQVTGGSGNNTDPSMADPLGLCGRTVSHFQVLDVLGAGGMGVVYRARDERLGRTVALKFPLPQYSLDAPARERFLQEARAASALDHPNVCTVYEASEDEAGHVFLAMACYAGETLKTRLARAGTLAVGQAADVARALLRALDVAHAAGIVHRDLKPGNVMLTADGSVKILDFGLATVQDLAVAGAYRHGTAAYMSPEQLARAAVDARSDLWSLGVVLYEMLTGRHPFGGGHELAAVYAILHDDPLPPSRVRPEIPAAWDTIVAGLLRKNPADRFATAEVVLAEMASALPAPEHVPRPARSRRRHMVWMVALALVGSGAAIAAGTAAVKGWLTADGIWVGGPTRSVAVLPFLDTSGDTANDHFADGLTIELIGALSKVRALHVAAHTSVFALKGKGLSIRALADTLGVATILEGSIRRAGDRLKGNLRLVRAEDGRILWSGDFDTQLTDVFGVQEQIARAVVDSLHLRVDARTRAALVGRPTRDPEAYDLYLQGRSKAVIRGSEHLDSAVAFFTHATERDPGFALAFAALADAYMATWNLSKPVPDILARAEAAASRAILLDASLGEAHASRAMVLATRGAYDDANRSFRRAIGLNPASVWSRHFYSMVLIMQLRLDEATSENSRALLLDPLNPAANTAHGVLLLLNGDTTGARRALRATIGISPDYVVAPYYLGALEAAGGNYMEARTLLEHAHARGSRFPGVRSALAYTYTRLDRKADAEALMDSLRAGGQHDRARVDHALGEAVMGDIDLAFALLERARWDIPTTHDLIVNPLLTTLRADRRYGALLRRIGIKR